MSKPSESSYRFRASKAQSLTVGKKKTDSESSEPYFVANNHQGDRTSICTGQRNADQDEESSHVHMIQGQEVQVSNRQSECEQHQLIAKLLGLKTVLAVPRLTTQSGIRGNYISRVIINCSS